MDQTTQGNGAPRRMENKQKINDTAPATKTACGNVLCECGRIMANLDLSKTPYFTVTSLDKQCGPALPDWFVQEHGDDATGNVILDAASTAGQILAVEFVRDEDEATGELRGIRMGEGWESFMLLNRLQAEDLLFFTLQGQARFIVMMIRGHSRREKRKQVQDTDDADVEEGSAELWRAAKQRKSTCRPAHDDDDDAFVTHLSSDDALGSYMLLSDGDSEDCDDLDDEDCSDFEDEREFLALFNRDKS